MLKNAKCTWSPRDCICSNFNLTTHLLNVSLKRKTDNISIMRLMTTKKRARAVGMLHSKVLVYVLLKLPIGIGSKSLNACVQGACQPESGKFSMVCCKLQHLCQHKPDICKHSWDKWLTCRIPATSSLFCSHTPHDDGFVACFSF